MAILVTGGAGYIGSHTVVELINQGEEVIVIDNLQTGHKPALTGGTFYQGDLRDRDFLNRVFSNHEIEAVIHFAASSLVGESVQKPLEYYENNLIASLFVYPLSRTERSSPYVANRALALLFCNNVDIIFRYW